MIDTNKYLKTQIPHAMQTGLFILLVFSARALIYADTILLDTGFEPPNYSEGPLLNQDGWVNSSVPVVQQAIRFNGTQSVRYDATGLTGQTSSRHPLSYSSIGNPESIVTLSIRVLISRSAIQSRWTILSLFSPGLFQAQVNVHPNGIAEFRTGPGPQGGFVPIVYDVWNRYELAVDFNSQLAWASMNGVFLGEKTLANPVATSLSMVGFGVNSAPGSDTAYFDDLRILSVPEPSSFGLVITGTAMTLFRRRSKPTLGMRA